MNNKLSNILIAIELNQTKEKDEFIRDKLDQFINQTIGQDFQYSIYAYDANKVIGGIIARREKSGIFIDILWIDDNYRYTGIGTNLLKAAEVEAIKHDVKYSTTDTLDFLDFLAVDFYLKNGYSEIGRIAGYVEGHDKVFLRKNLK